MLATVQRIIQARKDQTGSALQTWLQNLTAHELLQLGMVADVMDESLLLIRQVDNEECDSAEVGNYVQSFADRIQMLIVQKAILTTTGYTKLVMDLLAEGKLKFFACGVACRLGPCVNRPMLQEHGGMGSDGFGSSSYRISALWNFLCFWSAFARKWINDYLF